MLGGASKSPSSPAWPSRLNDTVTGGDAVVAVMLTGSVLPVDGEKVMVDGEKDSGWIVPDTAGMTSSVLPAVGFLTIDAEPVTEMPLT